MYLTLLGSAGLSAYAGLFLSASRLSPRRGETVVISAAAGGESSHSRHGSSVLAPRSYKLPESRLGAAAGGAGVGAFCLPLSGSGEAQPQKPRWHPTPLLSHGQGRSVTRLPA